MHHRLQEILDHKWTEVQDLKRRGLPDRKDDDLPPPRDFKKAIATPGRLRLIAEIKFASPSEGVIHDRMDPCAIGRVYEEAGAAAISLLTDTRFFGGRIKDLPRLKKAVSLPVLRKDFMIDPIQVKESLLHGADAILLIARILSKAQLNELLTLSLESGLAPLTEVHDPHDLEKAIDNGAEMIGINNRNLDTFEVSLQTTVDLASRIPGNCVIVSESGIAHPEDIRSLRKAGVHAFLIGTSLMKSDDMKGKISALLEAGSAEGSQNLVLRPKGMGTLSRR
jgi:indole-3-glycerol phosphate synthase